MDDLFHRRQGGITNGELVYPGIQSYSVPTPNTGDAKPAETFDTLTFGDGNTRKIKALSNLSLMIMGPPQARSGALVTDLPGTLWMFSIISEAVRNIEFIRPDEFVGKNSNRILPLVGYHHTTPVHRRTSTSAMVESTRRGFTALASMEMDGSLDSHKGQELALSFMSEYYANLTNTFRVEAFNCVAQLDTALEKFSALWRDDEMAERKRFAHMLTVNKTMQQFYQLIPSINDARRAHSRNPINFISAPQQLVSLMCENYDVKTVPTASMESGPTSEIEKFITKGREHGTVTQLHGNITIVPEGPIGQTEETDGLIPRGLSPTQSLYHFQTWCYAFPNALTHCPVTGSWFQPYEMLREEHIAPLCNGDMNPLEICIMALSMCQPTNKAGVLARVVAFLAKQPQVLVDQNDNPGFLQIYVGILQTLSDVRDHRDLVDAATKLRAIFAEDLPDDRVDYTNYVTLEVHDLRDEHDGLRLRRDEEDAGPSLLSSLIMNYFNPLFPPELEKYDEEFDANKYRFVEVLYVRRNRFICSNVNMAHISKNMRDHYRLPSGRVITKPGAVFWGNGFEAATSDASTLMRIYQRRIEMLIASLMPDDMMPWPTAIVSSVANVGMEPCPLAVFVENAGRGMMPALLDDVKHPENWATFVLCASNSRGLKDSRACYLNKGRDFTEDSDGWNDAMIGYRHCFGLDGVDQTNKLDQFLDPRSKYDEAFTTENPDGRREQTFHTRHDTPNTMAFRDITKIDRGGGAMVEHTVGQSPYGEYPDPRFFSTLVAGRSSLERTHRVSVVS